MAKKGTAMTSSDPTPGELCGARAEGGLCVLPRAHNMGQLDIPSNHQATVPGDHDELLDAADKYGPESMSSSLIRKLAAALRTEQSARQVLTQAALDHRDTAAAALNRAGRAEAERDALQQHTVTTEYHDQIVNEAQRQIHQLEGAVLALQQRIDAALAVDQRLPPNMRDSATIIRHLTTPIDSKEPDLDLDANGEPDESSRMGF